MITCSKCGALLSDDAKFCENCGANLAEEAAPQPVEAPAPEMPQQTEVPAAPVTKKSPKKFLLLGGIALAAVIAIVAALLLLTGGSKNADFVLYAKDKKVWFSDFANPMEITGKINLEDFSIFSLRVSKDGSKVFYAETVNYGENDWTYNAASYTLLYKDLSKKDPQAVKIDTNVSYYVINDSGTRVLYEKDGSLYLHNLKDKTRITNKLNRVWSWNKDLTKVVYATVSGDDDARDLYYWTDGAEKGEKLVSNYSNITYINEALSVVYYTKDAGTEGVPKYNLYKQTIGKDDAQKIATGIESASVMESGEIYYIKKDSGVERTLSDFLVDDLKASDAAMQDPWYQSFTNLQDKQAAQKAWAEKQERDSIRQQAKGKITVYSYTLYYYDGKESVEVTDAMADNYLENWAYNTATAVVSIRAENATVKISELSGIFELREFALGRDGDYALVIGQELIELDLEEIYGCILDGNSNVLYALCEYDEEEETGDLYKFSISKGKVGNAKLVDTDVYADRIDILWDASISYFKDCTFTESEYYSQLEYGDLYIDGKLVEYDVQPGILSVYDTKTVYYITDINEDEDSDILTVTIKMYRNGKSSLIAEEAYDFGMTLNGDLLYMTDYKREKGDLYRYTGGKSVFVDEDVYGILYPSLYAVSLGEVQNFFDMWDY